MFHSHRLAMRSGVDNGPEGKEVSAKAHKNAPDSNRGHRGDWRTYQSYQEDFRQGGAKTGEGRQCRCLGQNRQAACCRQAICRGASNSRNYSRRQRICIAFPQEGSSDQGEIEGFLIPAMPYVSERSFEGQVFLRATTIRQPWPSILSRPVSAAACAFPGTRESPGRSAARHPGRAGARDPAAAWQSKRWQGRDRARRLSPPP